MVLANSERHFVNIERVNMLNVRQTKLEVLFLIIDRFLTIMDGKTFLRCQNPRNLKGIAKSALHGKWYLLSIFDLEPATATLRAYERLFSHDSSTGVP